MSLIKPILLGQVVESIAGRDARERYLVVGVQGSYVLVSNGRERSMDRPKKKNMRHVRVYKKTSAFVENKFACNQKVTDEDIRQVLKVCKPDLL